MIGQAVYPFPYGFLQIEYEDDKVVYLNKIDNADEADGQNEKNKLTDIVFEQIMEYLDGKRKSFDFPYELRGTAFQKRVWEELCKIPYGETRTYQEIAVAIGNPKACRAVGMANNRNPIIIAVPCHRVIGANGKLIGYGGGLEMKEALLSLENKNR